MLLLLGEVSIINKSNMLHAWYWCICRFLIFCLLEESTQSGIFPSVGYKKPPVLRIVEMLLFLSQTLFAPQCPVKTSGRFCPMAFPALLKPSRGTSCWPKLFFIILILHLNTWRWLELKGWKQKWKLNFSFPAASLIPTVLKKKKKFLSKNEESIYYF